MTGQQFVYVALVAAAITLAVLAWALNSVKHRSSRLVALQVAGVTGLGLLALVGITPLVIRFLE